MNFLPALVSNLKNLLSKPGDKFTAEITPTGKPAASRRRCRRQKGQADRGSNSRGRSW